MTLLQRIFFPGQNLARRLSPADLVISLVIVAFVMLGVRFASSSPISTTGLSISLDPTALPLYALYSIGRMTGAYVLSMLFSLLFGFYAANNPRARWFMLPILDILQSIPILSFLPIVLLGFMAIMPQKYAVELASVILIVTSQAWNIAYSWYQSLSTIPRDLHDATHMFGLSPWYRFKTLMLPFGAIGLIWNSVISWSNGWFFLMAAEAFQVNQKDFRLPGIGAYLKVAADKGNTQAIISGVIVLIIMIVALDQLIWRPLVAWSERFRLDMVNAEETSSSWFLDVLNTSSLVGSIKRKVFRPLTDKIDYFMSRYLPTGFHEARVMWVRVALRWLCLIAFIAIVFYAFGMGALLLGTISLWQWGQLSLMVLATFLRVVVSLVLCLAWTVPIGVAIGMNPKIARWAQPFAQVAAAIPATALFPLFVLFLLRVSGTLEIPAILLMMSGIQWYLLFNIIAGASAIPQDLRYTASLMHMKGKGKWRDFILPSLFPYLVTGSVTAFTGAWNACIVAEYIVFQGNKHTVFGVGAMMSEATDHGEYAMLLASTLTLVVVVVLVNRFVWRRLFQMAEDRYRME